MLDCDEADIQSFLKYLYCGLQIFWLPEIILEHVLDDRVLGLLETRIPISSNSKILCASLKSDARIGEVWSHDGFSVDSWRSIIVDEELKVWIRLLEHTLNCLF